MEKLEQVSEPFDFEKKGLKKFRWYFYFYYLEKNGKFSYCIFFFIQRITSSK